jgi:tRNA(adenine34) deaminase
MPGKTTSKSDAHNNSHGKRKWSAAVTTDSTHPHAGLFNKDAKTIARELASKKVSPKGPSSGMRMLTFYINRAGKNLPAKRLKVLENAKELLHQKILAAKNQEKKATGKRVA